MLVLDVWVDVWCMGGFDGWKQSSGLKKGRFTSLTQALSEPILFWNIYIDILERFLIIQ